MSTTPGVFLPIRPSEIIGFKKTCERESVDFLKDVGTTCHRQGFII